MKERIKNIIENMTPGAKIRYIAVTALVLAIVASIAVFAAVNSSKEPNEIPASTESLTIEFDEEIVLDFGDGEDDTDAASESEIATDESEPAEESKESEKATESEKETEKETEKATEKEETEPATPSEDTEKNEPKPVVVPETQAPQTQPAVTRKPVTQNPVTQKPVTEAPVTQKPVTQAPATQAPVTQAPTTQAPTTQAPTTQAPVTQKPATEAPVTQAPATKPSVNEPEESKNYGSWVVKQKKYYYNSDPYIIWYKGMDDTYNGPAPDSNVVILNVENKSNEAYTITIKGNYLDASGNVIKTETKTFEGFAANWSNYFVFAPSIKFDKFTFEFSAKKYSGETYVQYFERYDKCGISTRMALDGGNGRESFYAGDGFFESAEKLINVSGGVRCGYTGSGVVEFNGDIVLFDKNGDLAYIRGRGKGNVTGGGTVPEDSLLSAPLFLTDIPYSEIDSYKIPDNLTSVTGFYAIESFVRK